jgi:hypothetical protein
MRAVPPWMRRVFSVYDRKRDKRFALVNWMA